MTHSSTTLFGSFADRLSTPVFADGWWLFRASQVELEGDGRLSHDLSAFLPECAPKPLRPQPVLVDAAWFRTVAPIGLQLGLEDKLQDAPLLLGFVAVRVHDDRPTSPGIQDMAYPFVFAERDGRLLLQFGTVGPAPEIQRDIAAAFVQRLLR
jgi:hypothetical protein